MVIHTWNLSTWEAEAPEDGKFEASVRYMVSFIAARLFSEIFIHSYPPPSLTYVFLHPLSNVVSCNFTLLQNTLSPT